MTNQKPLSELQLRAMTLLSQGASEVEVADILGKSRSWVQAVKRHPDYQKFRSESVSFAVENLKQETQKFVTDDLATFKERYKRASDLLFRTSECYLLKLQERIELLEAEDLSPSKLGQFLVSAANSLNLAFQIQQSVVGLEELMLEVESFEKISQESSS